MICVWLFCLTKQISSPKMAFKTSHQHMPVNCFKVVSFQGWQCIRSEVMHPCGLGLDGGYIAMGWCSTILPQTCWHALWIHLKAEKVEHKSIVQFKNRLQPNHSWPYPISLSMYQVHRTLAFSEQIVHFSNSINCSVSTWPDYGLGCWVKCPAEIFSGRMQCIWGQVGRGLPDSILVRYFICTPFH